MRQFFTSFFVLISLANLMAQSTPAINHSQYDSLMRRLDSLETVLKSTQSRMVTHSDFESILRSINEDDQEFTSDDRRSKRRALDSLFRTALSKPKQLTFTGQLMNVLHWNGQFDNSIHTAVGTVDLFAISSFGKSSLVFINLQGVGGNGPDAHVPTRSGWHDGAGSTQAPDGLDRINILEAWVEYSIKEMSFTIGKIDLTNYFDPNSVANDEYSQFLASAFVNNAAFAAPSNSPGISFNSNIGNYSLQMGVVSNDNSGDQIFSDLFSIIQLGKVFKVKGEEQGGIRAYAYHHPAASRAIGFGVSADARLQKKLYAFGRFGHNHNDLADTTGVKYALSTGLQFRNYSIFKSSNVSTGVGYGAIYDANTTSEQHIETYVRLNIKKVFFLSPHFQYVWAANGISNQNQGFLGLRTRVAF